MGLLMVCLAFTGCQWIRFGATLTPPPDENASPFVLPSGL